MAKEFAKAFYKSKAWQMCRRSYIAHRVLIDGGMCEECHNELGYIVHHKTPLTPDNINDPSVSLSHGNLSYVCKACHDAEEGHGVGHRAGNPGKPLLCSFGPDGMPCPP